MTVTNAKTKKSLLGLALGSLIVTSLPGTAEASWSRPRCATQCSKTIVGKNKDKLNNCATNCDNTKIMDLLLANLSSLTPDNLKSTLNTQQNIKQKQQTDIERRLRAELNKKKPSQSKIDALNEQQDQLIKEINALADQVSKMERAPSRPTRGTPSTHPEKKEMEPIQQQVDDLKALAKSIEADEQKSKEEEAKQEKIDISKPPSDMPPPLPEEKKEPVMSSGDEPMKVATSIKTPPSTNPGKIPTPPPPPMGKKPLTYKEKQDLLKQGQSASPQAEPTNVEEGANPTNKTPPKIPVPERSAGTGDLMAEIQKGRQLKKVDPNAPRPAAKTPPAQGGGDNMAEVLRQAMAKRRSAMEDKEKKPSPDLDFEQNFDD